MLRFENTRIDWVELKRITLTNYRIENLPFIRVMGLSRGDEALLWVQMTLNLKEI